MHSTWQLTGGRCGQDAQHASCWRRSRSALAVHYFPRGGYGYQQSLGCVELPYNAAARAYPYLTYGSLVTVDG